MAGMAVVLYGCSAPQRLGALRVCGWLTQRIIVSATTGTAAVAMKMPTTGQVLHAAKVPLYPPTGFLFAEVVRRRGGK